MAVDVGIGDSHDLRLWRRQIRCLDRGGRRGEQSSQRKYHRNRPLHGSPEHRVHIARFRPLKPESFAVEHAVTAWHNRRWPGPQPTMTARADRLTKRANPSDRDVPYRHPTLRTLCASSSMRSNGWTTAWNAPWRTPVSFGRILMTRTRAYLHGVVPDVLPGAGRTPDEECGHAVGNRDADWGVPAH